MKIKITVFGLLVSLLALAAFFSCDNTIALGKKLDVEGPVVTITSPGQRQAVPALFDIEGTAWDYSGVDTLLISAVKNNVGFPRQWRYQNKGWQISDDSGATWAPFGFAAWANDKEMATWKILADMDVPGRPVEEGEYTFNVQAWDKGGFTDDNSFRAVVLIVDLNPPKVEVTNPLLYRSATDSDFQHYRGWEDSSDQWKEPALLGKFITQAFSLKWQITDVDVWSIDLRFYQDTVFIDDNPTTDLPDNYIYRYFENTPPPPKGADPADYINLNGTVAVPALDSKAGEYDGGELKAPINRKTAIKVVAVCYDAAGNPNDERTLGYFIAWPRAAAPWMTFADGLKPVEPFYGRQVARDDLNPSAPYIEPEVFTVYPSRNIKITAFQAFGVQEVKYTLYEANTDGNTLNRKSLTAQPPNGLTVIGDRDTVLQNTAGKTPSTIFPWEIHVPPFTGYYIFQATAYSTGGKASETYTMLFRVNDITFPDFIEGPLPSATDPLFMSIDLGTKIKISGTLSDATSVESLCMVWINPKSEGFAAMSQLSYFRDSSYVGWETALDPTLTPSSGMNHGSFPKLDDNLSKTQPNKVWRIQLDKAGRDPDTNRNLYKFSLVIDISDHLNIGSAVGQNALKSQVFLFRAQNPDRKTTIITYAPQGDTLAPVVEISNIQVKQGTSAPQTFAPNTFKVIPKFQNDDTITINGTWWEDSVAYLDMEKDFLSNFNIVLNNQKLRRLTRTDLTGVGFGIQTGTWTITATVGNGAGQIPLERLKDTLVLGVDAQDIGGNRAEIGSSWLIESDNLRLMRISSEAEDGIYKAGDEIDIFLEFNKPVKLANPGQTPQLILNSRSGNAARAVYKEGQANLNSRQLFKYTVGATDSTGNDFLNVTGLFANGSAFTTETAYNVSNYPFSWNRGATANGDFEEVRITMQTNKTGLDREGNFYVRTLPTTTTAGTPDYQFTLRAGKNIKIDTTAPTVSSVASASIAGHYQEGDLYITVTFSKDVIAGATAPSLALAVTNGSGTSVSTDTDNVRVNGRTITFMYKIQPGDTTNGAVVRVTGSSGDIVDLAGNRLSGAITGTLGSGTTGVYIDTIPLNDPPVVRILSANNINNVVTNTVGGTTVTGMSGNAAVNLSTLYISLSDLRLAVQRADAPSTQAHRASKLEYSINDGTTWITASNTTNTPFPRPAEMTRGRYTVIARQITQSGIVSPVSRPITLNLDPGDFMTRVSTTSANGTYTNNTSNLGTRADTIPITVAFRKRVRFSAVPSITLNTSPAATVTASGYTANSFVTELNFTYAVGTDHNTPNNTFLDVTGFNGGTALDEDTVNVNNFVSLSSLPSASRLNGSKSITILTGALTAATPTGTFTDSQVSPNGIRDDGYNTALVFTFNRPIVKGSGQITIIQRQTGYRLPAVLTESQFNKYSGITNVNNFYSRGSNGYIWNSASDRRVDTSTKYILRYDIDTADTNNGPGTSSDIRRLAEEFRKAESVNLSINAGAVKIGGTGAQLNRLLIVELTGTNALQVPGATYAVTYPQGFVQDELNTPCPAVNNVNMGQALGGVAKPFIRINKTQDTITTATASNTQPRLVATQPLQANARMDCRTPDSSIRYNIQSRTSNTNDVNWNYQNTNPNDFNDQAPDRPADPQSNNTTYTNPLTIGEASGNNAYQGLQWYVRAKARTGTSTVVWSADSEEMAFKTVITYVLASMPGTAANQSDNGFGPASGDQIWIRGGDAVGLSSVPGFPLNWDVTEFNDARDEKRRAGIRLFTMTEVSSTLGTWGSNPSRDHASNMATRSVWKFVTWEINVDTYFDIILGRDSSSTAAEALQYGPRQFAYQRAGWTSFKTETRALPGKHRWLQSNNQDAGKGTLNFSSTFGARPQFTGSNITFTP